MRIILYANNMEKHMKVTYLELKSMIDSLKIKKKMLELWIENNNVVESEDTLKEGVSKLTEHGDVIDRLINLETAMATLKAKWAGLQVKEDYLVSAVEFIESLPDESKDAPYLMINSDVKWGQKLELTAQIALVALELAGLKTRTKVDIE